MHSKKFLSCLLLSFISLVFVQADEGRVMSSRELILKLAEEAPELIEYSNHFSTKKMNAGDEPIIWLQKVVSELAKKGEDVVFEIKTVKPGQEPRSFGGIVQTQGKIRFLLPIRPKMNQARRANSLWSRLVLEVANLEMYKKNQECISQLKNNEINADEFVKNISRIHYRVACRVKLFYDTTWITWSSRRACAPITPTEWFVYAKLDSHEAWYKQMEKTGQIKLWSNWAETLKMK